MTIEISNVYMLIPSLYSFQRVDEPMEQFLSIVMESLEKNWFDFNTSTQDALVEVAGHVMNSKAGVKLSGGMQFLLYIHIIFHASSSSYR